MSNPLTTATSIGVAVRYLTSIVGAVVAILGALNWLTPQQVEALTQQVPVLVAAVAALVAAVVPAYAIITKSFSDKAAEVAKAVDKAPPTSDVLIETPGNMPNIKING